MLGAPWGVHSGADSRLIFLIVFIIFRVLEHILQICVLDYIVCLLHLHYNVTTLRSLHRDTTRVDIDRTTVSS
jgi:hypothetical protein